MSSCDVSCCRLDWQRPFGEDFDHPDDIVWFQRRVAPLKRGVEHLHGRPVGYRDAFWGTNLTRMEGELDNAQKMLRLCEDVKDNGRSYWAMVRHQQLLQQLKALWQYRY